ncbi:MAG: hypothetical protein JL50_00960 [Peptococcaceae bacterium BICA1-7]|nr:MAG: hypothetical protein JL50_00960 [Peptococcaceae bacterium BICA1-7]HBV98041.1 hydrolase [Desulfotomaculum sp.]
MGLPTKKFECPCCGYFTLSEQPPGTFEICPVCYWEDDSVQYNDPNYEGGANKVSLNKARENFINLGAIGKEYVAQVRPPLDEEKRANQ